MAKPSLRQVSEDIAQQVAQDLKRLEERLRFDDVYVYAIVLSDDFAQVAGYANTESHYAASDRSMLQKWYFGQWFAQGMDLAPAGLVKGLGDATDDDPKVQAAWLLALTGGLRLLQSRGKLKFHDRPLIAFCSMISSLDAIWIESMTGKAVNPPELWTPVAPEIAAASAEWYGTETEEPSDLRLAFDAMRK